MSKVKNLPLTLDEVLSCSETIMMQEAKVVLIAMVKRQRRVGSAIGLPLSRKDLCAKLGMDPAVGLEAIRQLVKLDYLHRDGENVQLVIGHPVVAHLEVGNLNTVPAEELEAKVAEILAPKPSTPKRAAAVARAVGKDEPPKPAPKPAPKPRFAPQVKAVPAAEGNPKVPAKKAKKKSSKKAAPKKS